MPIVSKFQELSHIKRGHSGFGSAGTAAAVQHVERHAYDSESENDDAQTEASETDERCRRGHRMCPLSQTSLVQQVCARPWEITLSSDVRKKFLQLKEESPKMIVEASDARQVPDPECPFLSSALPSS